MLLQPYIHTYALCRVSLNYQAIFNRISGVMIGVIASNVVANEFGSQWGHTQNVELMLMCSGGATWLRIVYCVGM